MNKKLLNIYATREHVHVAEYEINARCSKVFMHSSGVSPCYWKTIQAEIKLQTLINTKLHFQKEVKKNNNKIAVNLPTCGR